MVLTVNKALPDLSKLEPLDRTNYRCWSQKLLAFFKQIEVDYMLFSDSLKRATFLKSLMPPFIELSKANRELVIRKQ